MFQPSEIEEYRAVKAPEALKARVVQAAQERHPLPMRRLIPRIAAVAACLVLIAVGFAAMQPPSVTITASPGFVMARSASQDAYPTIPLLLQADGTLTVEAASPSVTAENGDALTLPMTAEHTLTLWWTVDTPTATVTVNGRTYTLHADPETCGVTVS